MRGDHNALSLPADVAGLARCCPMPRHALSFSLLSLSAAALAQSGPAAEPAPPATPAAAPQQVEVTGARAEDSEARRRSTASKIVVGRDEIERYGDSTLGDLLKRLPGVTLDGRSGRGGNIRMRGLGGGYTQILLDGERVQGGLSLDQLDPEQVERIEIIRAPTAETGARAIAGTINVVTREGFRKRLNDLKLGLNQEAGQWGGNASWTREDKLSETLSYNLSVSTWSGQRHDAGASQTRTDEGAWDEAQTSDGQRQGLWTNARLQWRGAGGDQFMLMPAFSVHRSDSERRSQLDVLRDGADEAPDYANSLTGSDSRSRFARLNAQWKHTTAGGWRLETRGGVGQSRASSHSLRQETDADGALLRTLDESSTSTDRTTHVNGKASLLLDSGHQLVTGIELEGARREDRRVTLQNGVEQLPQFGTAVQARTLRQAVYAQDEFDLNPNWALHGGLRWEGIGTVGEDLAGDTPARRSSVWTPLFHAVYKPDPKGRDQLRLSLTRSYRSPQLGQLIALPSLSSRYPVPGANTPNSPDRAGNPDLAPELATGIDLAFERYLSEGGLLSVNLFHRRIRGLMRTLTTLETVPWSDQPRWVARPQNVGDASTSGVEFELKSRLRALWPEAPQVDLRANASVFRSRVAGVPGPDNRLDQQPGATANLGADWKLATLPLTVGASVNWTPGYTTRLSESQWLIQGRKQSVDAYLLWQLAPWARLRLSASNLAPEDALSTSQGYGETTDSSNQTYVNWRTQLELKL